MYCFCSTTIWIRHKYTYSPSLLSLPPTPTSYPSLSTQSTCLSSLLYIATSKSYFTHSSFIHVKQSYSLNSPYPFLPHCVHKSILYICISIPALQIGSHIKFLCIIYMICINMLFVFLFMNLLHSVWQMLGPSHLYKWPVLFLFMGFLCSSAGKEFTCNAGDPGLIPGSGRSPGEVMGNPLQYSWASLVAQIVKNPPEMWKTWIWSLGLIPGSGRSPGEWNGYLVFIFLNLLHSLWQMLGPSTSLQMTHVVCVYDWAIFHCMYVPPLLYLSICQWIFRLLPYTGYCK